MSEAPERIWAVSAWDDEFMQWKCGQWDLHQDFIGDVEYIRADLPPSLPAALAVPEVAALHNDAKALLKEIYARDMYFSTEVKQIHDRLAALEKEAGG